MLVKLAKATAIKDCSFNNDTVKFFKGCIYPSEIINGGFATTVIVKNGNHEIGFSLGDAKLYFSFEYTNRVDEK